jgi:hypothetical protein
MRGRKFTDEDIETLNQRILDLLKAMDGPIKCHVLWRAMGYDPRHYQTLRTRLSALCQVGIVLKLGETAGTKYQLVEGW